MATYELTLKGFDALTDETDETDDKIIWITVPDNAKVALREYGSNPIKSITEIKVMGNNSGIDLIIK